MDPMLSQEIQPGRLQRGGRRQIDAGVQAGGGPKSVDVGPANCDHF
jgi:hypothetical protein